MKDFTVQLYDFVSLYYIMILSEYTISQTNFNTCPHEFVNTPLKPSAQHNAAPILLDVYLALHYSFIRIQAISIYLKCTRAAILHLSVHDDNYVGLLPKNERKKPRYTKSNKERE